jgi:60 kDa SS-A/Ro ribonucleoprotein
MTNKYAQHVSDKVTPQTEPIFGKNQVKNNAGGYVFQIENWSRLNRFLVLGSEGGSYYATERKLSIDNAKAVIACIKEDGVRTVDAIVEISQAGRAPKNDPAIFALALVAKHGDDKARSHAYQNLSKVCRIATHLFQFLSVLDTIGKGTGLGLRKAVQRWYNDRELGNLALQVIKYRNREGFEHRDALRLAHVNTNDAARNEIYKWVAWNRYKGGKDAPVSAKNDVAKAKYASKHDQIVSWVNSHYNEGVLTETVHPLINAFEQAQRAKTPKEIVSLIQEHRLPREAVPTELLNTIEVWDALLPHMPLTAMIRNIATMTRIGLIAPLSDASKIVMAKLGDAEALKKARVHPIQVLSALKTYQQGHGVRGNNTWTPVQTIVDSLDDAFYASFDNVTPTGKNIMIGLDVSASMTWGDIAGVPGLNPRVASAAMAMVTAKVEKNVYIKGFSHNLVDIDISGKSRLADVIHTIERVSMGGTDCSLPMLDAMQNNLKVDAFFTYTDNETWAGRQHPVQTLNAYRKKSGINAKSVVVGMTATEFSIADPNDAGMLDVVGFDTAAPQVMSEFIK